MKLLVVFLVFIALPLFVAAYVMTGWVRHARKMKRMDKFGRWVKTIPTMPLREQEFARGHILRILAEGPCGGYHGPWEALP